MRKSLIIIMLLGTIGCGTLPVTVATSNVTKPVLVGKVTKIKGEPRTEFGEMVNTFSITAENSSSYQGDVNGGYTSSSLQEGANKFDVELLRLASPEDTQELIMVDNIGVAGKKSEALFLTFVFRSSSDYTSGTINGAVYKPHGVKK